MPENLMREIEEKEKRIDEAVMLISVLALEINEKLRELRLKLKEKKHESEHGHLQSH